MIVASRFYTVPKVATDFANQWQDGSTITHGIGSWNGITEPQTTIEIIGSDTLRESARKLLDYLRARHGESEIWEVEVEGNLRIMKGN